MSASADPCGRARQLVSRRLDGDSIDGTAAAAWLETHLDSCAECRTWQQQAAFLQRQVAAARLDPPAGLRDDLVRATRVVGRRTGRWTLLVRALIAALATVGLALAAPALVLGSDDGIETHAAHEIGSTDVALCIGLFAAALWPRRARGVLAVVGAAAALLLLTAGDDILAGRTTWWHETPHAVAVVGALLVWVLARLVPDSAPPVPMPAAALFEETAERPQAQADPVSDQRTNPIRRIG